MDNIIKEKVLTGERALFKSNEISVYDCTFCDGESPLKESTNVKIERCKFEWKYPLWYCKNVIVNNSYFDNNGRSGIWYTDNITINDTIIDAPKQFRRSKNITLNNVKFNNALETMWSSSHINMQNVYVRGDYFAMNCENVYCENIRVDGNYIFDGSKNVHVKNSVLNSKDSFWNCKDCVIENSTIIGEYIGWNSENITFINCEVESLQGFCYMKNVKLRNCKLINTTLAFEYSSVEATIDSEIDSVFNPESGYIQAKEIKELILDEKMIEPKKTTIKTEK